MKRCAGFGPNASRIQCPNAPDAEGVWCPSCNAERIAYLDKRFDELEESMHSKRAAD